MIFVAKDANSEKRLANGLHTVTTWHFPDFLEDLKCSASQLAICPRSQSLASHRLTPYVSCTKNCATASFRIRHAPFGRMEAMFLSSGIFRV